MTFLLLLISCFELKFSTPGDGPNHGLTINEEIEVKSKLGQKNDRVIVDLSLPADDQVGFQLATTTGDLQHGWNSQQLSRGRHQLSLPLPQLSSGPYWLHIQIGTTEIKHLLVIP